MAYFDGWGERNSLSPLAGYGPGSSSEKRRSWRERSLPKRVAGVPNVCNGRGQWAGNTGGVLLRFWRASLSVYFREVRHDRELKDHKYPMSLVVSPREIDFWANKQ